jgi:predicted AlkP superfamily phosphohydrolase/phosphomutase
VASQILFTGVDWSKTKAYHTAEFPGSIRVNMRGREIKGIVEAGAEYDAVCEAIGTALEGYVDPDTGERIVERVIRREELFWGPYVENAPDLIVQIADYAYTIDWFMPVAHNGAGTDLPIIDTLTGRFAVNCGYHRPNGVLMLEGADIRKGLQLDVAHLYDVVPTALYLMGLPVPADMDGRVLTEAINADLLDRQPVEDGDRTSTVTRAAFSEEHFSEAEAEAVANRLRDLGYL